MGNEDVAKEVWSAGDSVADNIDECNIDVRVEDRVSIVVLPKSFETVDIVPDAELIGKLEYEAVDKVTVPERPMVSPDGIENISVVEEVKLY